MMSTTHGLLEGAPPPRMTSPSRGRRAIIAAAAAGCLALSSITASAFAAEDAAEPVNVTVDYAVDAGPSNQVASGFLHGIDAVDPAQHLIDGVDVRTIRGADHHPNLPSLFDRATYDRVKATGVNLQVGVYYYKDAVDNPLSSYRPGDGGDWDTWREIVRGVVQEAIDNQYVVDSWIVWNEPNLQWNTSQRPYTRYLQAHKIAHDVITSVDPGARVQGPEVYGFNMPRLTEFLTFCKANDCLPDLLTWHELSPTPTSVPQHVKEINDWMVANGITPMPVAITEFQGQGYGNPNAWHAGQHVRWLAQFERAATIGLESANVASWEWDGQDPAFRPTLGNAVSRDLNTPRGAWWNLNAYRDMTGHLVSTVSGDVPEFTGPDTIYEAETAQISGAQIASNWGGFTGTGFWNPLNASGDWAEWTVDAEAAGTYTLFVRYANGGTGDRPSDVAVNGEVVTRSAFPRTSGWSGWAYEVVHADLVQGQNTIRVTNTGSRGPNIDHLGVTAGEVTIAGPAPVDALSGFDPDLRRSVTLVGNQTAEAQDVNLRLTNIPSELIRSDAVRARVAVFANTPAVPAPVVELDADVAVVDGRAEVPFALPAGASARVDIVPSLADAAVIRLEAEGLDGVVSDGSATTRTESQAAGAGAAVVLATPTAGGQVTYSIEVPRAGVYRLDFGGGSSEGAGVAQLYVDGEAVGGPIDQSGDGSFTTTAVGVIALSAGSHQVEVREVRSGEQPTADAITLDFFELLSLTADKPAPAAYDVTVVSRCVGGKNQVRVTVTNNDEIPLAITVAAEFGERTFRVVGAGKSMFHPFTTHLATLPEGELTATAEGERAEGDVSTTRSFAYDAHSCG